VESIEQERIIWHHFCVSTVCGNLVVTGPIEEHWIMIRRTKERRYIVEPEECVAVRSCKKFRWFDALEGMVDAAIHNEPVNQ